MNSQIVTFEKIIKNVSSRYGISTVFSDFLQMVVCALSMQQKEELYMQTISRYEKEEVNRMADAFASLIVDMNNKEEGLLDVLGPFFTFNITNGENGQFFTPNEICKFMAHVVDDGHDFKQKRVLDPSCGAGTLLLAKAEQERSFRKCNIDLYYGADVDRRCAMMTAINLCLNGLLGEVAWMDSLSNEYFGGWAIDLFEGKVPYLREITAEESIIYLNTKEISVERISNKNTQMNHKINPIFEEKIFNKPNSNKPSNPSQLTLF